MARIKRISGPYLHRAWLNIPHVTHNDEADVTELEAFRKQAQKMYLESELSKAWPKGVLDRINAL